MTCGGGPPPFFCVSLLWAVLGSATASKAANNSCYGMAIGLTVTAGVLSIGNVSGCAMNPAVATALALSEAAVGKGAAGLVRA